ncbi:MAG: replication factor C large subunit [Candidatus Aenigmatarchaeota archaeon]
MWTQKYKPKSLKEFVNQKEAVEKFLKWVRKKKRDKVLLFFGPPGTGKTALVEAYANENNLDLIELNASDYRNAAQIRGIIGSSAAQASLFKKGKIFLIDEIDGLSGVEDRGGVGEIIKIIKESIHPIILTANNPYDPKLKNLKQFCELVEFKKIHVLDIEKRLKGICEKEKIETDKDVLREIARKSNGDLRSAINDLEMIARGKNKIGVEDLDAIGYREKETSIFDALKIIFKTQIALSAKLAINNVDKDPEEIFWWIENNITKEFEKPEEIAKAFEMLSKADLFRQWIISRQYWKFKAYMVDLMTAGIATAKKEMYRKFTYYQYPDNLIILGSSKTERKDIQEILKVLSEKLHCSTKKLKLHLPYLKVILKKSKNKKEIIESLGLTEEQINKL